MAESEPAAPIAKPISARRDRRRIVDAVTDHADKPAFANIALDHLEFVLGKLIAERFINPNLMGDGTRGCGIIASEHDRLDTKVMQRLDGNTTAILDCVGNGEEN